MSANASPPLAPPGTVVWTEWAVDELERLRAESAQARAALQKIRDVYWAIATDNTERAKAMHDIATDALAGG